MTSTYAYHGEVIKNAPFTYSREALLPPCPLPCPLRFVPCIFIARRFQLFLPSSTRVELCLPTLLAGTLSSCFRPVFFPSIDSKSDHGEI